MIGLLEQIYDNIIIRPVSDFVVHKLNIEELIDKKIKRFIKINKPVKRNKYITNSRKRKYGIKKLSFIPPTQFGFFNVKTLTLAKK